MKRVGRLLGLHPKYPTHTSNYQPHPALQHLKITFQPDEYSRILQAWDKIDPPRSYIEKLPTYVIARCPFCHAEYKAVLDTHSLRSWQGVDNTGYAIWREKYEQRGCDHFLAIHTFINLNGLFPEEKKNYFRNDYDVPFVSPTFLPEDPASYVVMHSLPICSLEDGRFVPRYALYTLTYYVPERLVSWEVLPNTQGKFRRGPIAENRKKEYQYEWEDFLYYPFQARQHPDWWDLPLWIKKKNLFWLDPASRKLTLTNEPSGNFPYSNVQGYRRAIEIRNGKFRFLD